MEDSEQMTSRTTGGPSDFFLKHPHHRPCLKTNTENYSWSFCLNLRLSEVQEHGCGCAWPWKWWWPRGRLRLADNKNGARMSRVSVLKWAKSSRNCSAACGKDSFQTDMTRWHPELEHLHFLILNFLGEVSGSQNVERKKTRKKV